MIGLIDRGEAAVIADRLKAFAQPQRLMILASLVDVELSVGAIDEATGIGQPALSQQLAELRRAQLVSQRRRAKQIFYRLADERVTAIIRFLAAAFLQSNKVPPISPFPQPRPVEVPAQPVAAAARFAIVERSRDLPSPDSEQSRDA